MINFGEISLMRIFLAVVTCLMLSVAGRAQFYYNDIISSRQSNANYKLLKQSNISQVKGISYEADGQQAENFMVEQELSRDKKRMITRATSTDNVTTITTSYYENDRLTKTVDSLVTVSTATNYEYDVTGQLIKISSYSSDPEHEGISSEVHEWSYQQDGKPARMLKIKNRADTIIISFIYDEKGNLAEETWKKKNTLLEHYYYYYNEGGQIADIVRYDARFKKLLPDYAFDYDTAGRVTKMLQRINGTTNYLNWVYAYDERGLRQKEVCVDKNNRVVGRVEYTYSR
jgi:hypothetical protein